MPSDKFELKAYKMLATIYAGMFHTVRSTAMRCVEYRQDKPEEVMKEMEHIANPDKWDYCGLLNKDNKAVLETLEFLLDDDMGKIRIYNAWKPMGK